MEKGFTLVIPLYNKVNCVRQTLDSVLHNHGEYPFKCIIVDDDSTDGSSEIGEEYDEKYPDVFQYLKIKHRGSKRPSNARNIGIKLTNTEYIGFLDADDELLPGFIDRGCSFLDDHPEYNLYGNGHKTCIVNENNKKEFDEWNYWSNDIKNFFDYIDKGGRLVSFCASIYKTELVKTNLFRDCVCEDADFQLRYAYIFQPLYIDNSTCETFIYNLNYSDVSNNIRNDQKLANDLLIRLSEEIPNFKYEFYADVDNKLWYREKK
jgi:glycosyltransferase involved in cell wall biosynthesis